MKKENLRTTAERCPYCENEVEIKLSNIDEALSAICPSCKRRIKICSMCDGVTACNYNEENAQCRTNYDSPLLLLSSKSNDIKVVISDDFKIDEFMALCVIRMYYNEDVNIIVSPVDTKNKDGNTIYLNLNSTKDLITQGVSNIKELLDKALPFIVSKILGEQEKFSSRDIWMNKYAYIMEQLHSCLLKYLLAPNSPINESSLTLIKYKIMDRNFTETSNTSIADFEYGNIDIDGKIHPDVYRTIKLYISEFFSRFIEDFEDLVIYNSDNFKECAYCGSNMKFAHRTESSTEIYVCSECGAKVEITPRYLFKNAIKNREEWSVPHSENESYPINGREDFCDDELGGHHAGGVGTGPDRIFCGECSSISCGDCKVYLNRKKELIKDEEEFMTSKWFVADIVAGLKDCDLPVTAENVNNIVKLSESFKSLLVEYGNDILKTMIQDNCKK